MQEKNISKFPGKLNIPNKYTNMKLINNMKIGTRLNLFLSATIIILLSAFGIYTFKSQMKDYLEEADIRMKEEVNNLSILIEQQYIKSSDEGFTATDSDKTFIKEVLSKKKYYIDGYPYLVAKDGTALIHPTNEGENFSGLTFFVDMQNTSEEIGRTEYIWEDENKVQYFKYLEPLDAYVSVTFYEKNLKDRVNKSIYSLIIVIVSLVILFILINWQLSRSITVGLSKAVAFAKGIASGNLTLSLDIERKDEIGQLATSLKDMSKKLEEIIADVIQGSNYIASASRQLSVDASEQAAATEEVSSSMEQMIANIQQNSENANETERIAHKASTEIGTGYENVNQTVKSMLEIAENITIVEEIAEKTDLLAINAAIEAARAGDHGKGFAVVAMEVRKLAERSQQAAAQINQVSKSSVSIAKETGRKMGEIVPEIQRTSTLVQEISSASREQNSGADQVNSALTQLNQSNQNTAASSEELAGQAAHLKDVISFFKTNNYNHKSNGHSQHMKTTTVVSGIQTPKQQPNLMREIDYSVETGSDSEFEHF